MRNMRKLIYAASLLAVTAFWGVSAAMPVAAAAAQRTSTVAVVLLGSLEFQDFDYFDIAAESLIKKSPATQYKLAIGDYPQQMFNRFSDKKGLMPGEIPGEEKLAEFAWSHSFDEVIFVLLTAPHTKSNEITVLWENAEATVTARALRFDSRSGKKLSDAKSTQTVKALSRNGAKKTAFRKCLESLRDQI